MRQWKLLVALAMLLAFVAGAVIGVGRSRMHDSPFDRPRGVGPPEMRLSEELGLSPDQRDQLRRIWEPMIEDGLRLDEQRRDIEQRYRDASLSLLTPDQRQKYDALVTEADQALEKLEDDRRANFLAAIDKTKALLTPDQREKYDQIMSRHHGPPGPPHLGPPDLLGPRHHHGPPPAWLDRPSTTAP